MSKPRNLLSCRRCPRLQKQFKTLRKSHPDYWNKPVPASGSRESKLIIVGLAPGMHGANRTGIPFTGDASGQLLFKTLCSLGIDQQVRITNVVKCLPVKNLPSSIELTNCRKYLEQELDSDAIGDGVVIFALGRVAHASVIKTLMLRPGKYPFAHGAVHELIDDGWLVDSYHCSRYNTQTGRLTEAMFMDAMKCAARLSGLIE